MAGGGAAMIILQLLCIALSGKFHQRYHLYPYREKVLRFMLIVFFQSHQRASNAQVVNVLGLAWVPFYRDSLLVVAS